MNFTFRRAQLSIQRFPAKLRFLLVQETHKGGLYLRYVPLQTHRGSEAQPFRPLKIGQILEDDLELNSAVSLGHLALNSAETALERIITEKMPDIFGV